MSPDGLHGPFRNQEGDAGTLRIIVLLGNVEHRSADHLGQMLHDLGQALGIVLFVNVGDIILLLALRFGIAYVVNIKA